MSASFSLLFALCVALNGHAAEINQNMMRREIDPGSRTMALQTAENNDQALEDQRNVVKTEVEKTNIYFAGKERKDLVVASGRTSKLLRPDLVKFIRCKDFVCSDCPSRSACGWSANGGFGSNARFQLTVPTSCPADWDTHVAEYWASCTDGQGEWIINKNVVGTNINDDMKVYLVEEGGNFTHGEEVTPSNQKSWTIEALDGPGRVRVVIKPPDCSKEAKAFVKVRGSDVKESAATCMDTKMCLKELDGENEAASELRNNNSKQLQCLSNTEGSTSNLCQAWRTCLDVNEVDKHMLLAILEAAVPHNSGSLAELEPASKTRSTDDEVTGSCLHPANDDPESWECECGTVFDEECDTTSAEALKECIHLLMCGSSKVCQSWKDDRSCPSPSLAEDETQRSGSLDDSLVNKASCR